MDVDTKIRLLESIGVKVPPRPDTTDDDPIRAQATLDRWLYEVDAQMLNATIAKQMGSG